ncbi:hypothetical protein GIB67_017725 [Kingdonia uniflora]|uniref:RNA helicase n=1 Tax=Kingdonia uniflora TaxID=39325 RepID=A0A7J7NA82_9MAGN|nr:hypothetical protein GIB67_017725 [Kingdonia uniflora]
MAPTTASSTGPRYALADPTLPKPWRGLVDGSTGNLYFWNPVTNVTQYEKPVAAAASPPPPSLPLPPTLASTDISSPSDEPPKSIHKEAASCKPVVSSGLATSQNVRSSASDVPSKPIASLAAPSAQQSPASNLSVDAYRRQHEITISEKNAPPPFMSFPSTGFPAEILREVQKAGFTAPTPIQAQSWPLAMRNRDIVAIAKTGSGKTLGYILPGFMHIKRFSNNPQKGPTVLILSPTRELATQIQDEAEKFGNSSRILSTCLYGGAPKGPQIRDIQNGVDIVVATPGRLNDILEMGKISFCQVSYLVLDEADRMLDMGFEPQIRKIVKEIPARRQTLMFTATWPKEVRKIASDLLSNPVQVNIGNSDELVANKSITQYVEVVTHMEKQRRLEQIIRSQEPGSKIIIFCSTKRMCDQLANSVTRQFGSAAIHGDKSQDERDSVLNQFRNGRTPILVATDVAARGLDVKDIRVVINYDFPNGVEDYVHRIGRTGRGGATGLAYTFFSDQNAKHAPDLIKILEGANQQVPAELRNMSSYGGGMDRPRQQWSSGSGGRDGGRFGRNDGPNSGRGAGGYNHEPQDRYGGNFNDGNSKQTQGNSGDGWGWKPNNDRCRSRSPPAAYRQGGATVASDDGWGN